jgi:hypothetical protein
MDKSQLMPAYARLANLQRPFFSPGLLLEDDDLNAGVKYTSDLTRLLFKSLFGCGVICGLKVSYQPICNGSQLQITVAKGVALDCMGDPIEVPSDQTFDYNPNCDPIPPEIWVVLCYAEKCCRPKDVSCSDDRQPQPTRIKATFEIKLYKAAPKCACSCEAKVNVPTQAGPRHDCCPEPQTPNTTATTDQAGVGDPSAVPDSCQCYKGHFDGECECDCACKCVVIGKINVGVPKPDDSMVRRIRPLLRGYVECRLIPANLVKREQKKEYTEPAIEEQP